MLDKVLPISQARSLSHFGCSSKQHQLPAQLDTIIYEMHEWFNGDLPVRYTGTIVGQRFWE